MGDQEERQVQLYVYDLSQGFASQISQAVLGKQIGGIWHTAVVVGGVEYFYGGGVQRSPAGMTPYGRPVEVIQLGYTQIPQEVLDDYIGELSQVFTQEAYNLLTNNCNNFSNELSLFLTGSPIPEHITRLPNEVLSTPFGQMLAPMLGDAEAHLGNVRQGDPPQQLQSPLPWLPFPAQQQGPTLGFTPLHASHTLEAATVDGHGAGAELESSSGSSARTSSAPPAQINVSNGQAQPGDAAAKQKSAAAAGSEKAAPQAVAQEFPQSSSSQVAKPNQADVQRTKAAFEAAVRAEFARIMASGTVTANEAAAQALAAARQNLSSRA